MVVTAGDMRIAGGKFKAAFHGKPKMLAAEEVEERIGHAVGGVCPFALKDVVRVFLDVSTGVLHLPHSKNVSAPMLHNASGMSTLMNIYVA